MSAARAEFTGSLAILTSFQREGVVIVDIVLRADISVPVMTIDTGRLPAATLLMMSSMEQRYGITVQRILPEPAEVNSMVDTLGSDLFYDGVAERRLCCNIRKVRPLALAMSNTRAYFTGLRRLQSDTRANTEVFDRSGFPVKISPLADWTSEDVAQYTLANGLPEHPLYAAGYASIGCDPCTRAVAQGEDERAGRWWWEQDTAKECGLHFTPGGRAERTVDVLLRDVLSRVNP